MSEFEVKINNRVVHKTKNNLKWIVKYCIPYMTNDDLNELNEYIAKLKIHREKKEAESKIEVEKHSWPYPDTKKETLNVDN
jgi:hypothetical protein